MMIIAIVITMMLFKMEMIKVAMIAGYYVIPEHKVNYESKVNESNCNHEK